MLLIVPTDRFVITCYKTRQTLDSFSVQLFADETSLMDVRNNTEEAFSSTSFEVFSNISRILDRESRTSLPIPCLEWCYRLIQFYSREMGLGDGLSLNVLLPVSTDITHDLFYFKCG